MVGFEPPAEIDLRSKTIEELLFAYAEAYYWQVESCSQEMEQECSEKMEAVKAEVLRRCGQ